MFLYWNAWQDIIWQLWWSFFTWWGAPFCLQWRTHGTGWGRDIKWEPDNSWDYPLVRVSNLFIPVDFSAIFVWKCFLAQGTVSGIWTPGILIGSLTPVRNVWKASPIKPASTATNDLHILLETRFSRPGRGRQTVAFWRMTGLYLDDTIFNMGRFHRIEGIWSRSEEWMLAFWCDRTYKCQEV